MPAPLALVLESARRTGPRGVVVFDLDSTIFDNRPRQVRILREFGAGRGIECLARNRLEHWPTGWHMRAALINSGLSDEEALRILPDARQYWGEHFFTSEYCVEDVPLAGAPEYLAQIAATRVQIAYVSGRPRTSMEQGTLESLRRHGLPMPGPGVHLHLKTDLYADDDGFKLENIPALRALGEVLAAFDNEPAHLNIYRTAFPSALVVRLLTDDSGRSVSLLPGVLEVPDFGGARAPSAQGLAPAPETPR